MNPSEAPSAEPPTTRAQEIIEERPSGLAGGEFAWPAWGIGLLGGSLLLGSSIWWLRRLWKRRGA